MRISRLFFVGGDLKDPNYMSQRKISKGRIIGIFFLMSLVGYFSIVFSGSNIDYVIASPKIELYDAGGVRIDSPIFVSQNSMKVIYVRNSGNVDIKELETDGCTIRGVQSSIGVGEYLLFELINYGDSRYVDVKIKGKPDFTLLETGSWMKMLIVIGILIFIAKLVWNYGEKISISWA